MRILEDGSASVHAGDKFGRWTVIGAEFYYGFSARGSLGCVVCECECGHVEAILSGNLRAHKSTQCIWCRAKSGKRNANYLHGESKTRLYKSWAKMIERCESKSYHAFARYGGRGIRVCEEWRNDYRCFRDWALINGWREGLEIDRIDNDGNYEPSNCQWLTKSENKKKSWLDSPDRFNKSRKP